MYIHFSSLLLIKKTHLFTLRHLSILIRKDYDNEWTLKRKRECEGGKRRKSGKKKKAEN